MSHAVRVTTGSRLHFGLIVPNPDRDADGIVIRAAGVMIDSPGWQLTVRPVDGPKTKVAVTDPRATDAEKVDAIVRCHEYCRRLRSKRELDPQGAAYAIDIERMIPAHVGLGSGTQLAMALAHAIAQLAGHEVEPLPEVLGRGSRSLLGTAGFRFGGFLADFSGEQTGSHQNLFGKRLAGFPVLREEVPERWRFVLVVPKNAPGLHGTSEQQAFDCLPPMPDHLSARLTQLVLNRLLQGLASGDLTVFGNAIFELNREIGTYFSGPQGGIYAHSQMVLLANELRERGIHGVGQSSWGPILFAIVADSASATELIQSLSADERFAGCQFRMAAPLNRGAEIHSI